MDLSCFIKGQAVCNFSFRRVEGRAYVSLRPGQRIYLYPGLEFGYVNGLFGSLSSSESTKTTAFSYRHGFPLIELCTQSYNQDGPKFWDGRIHYDPSSTNQISQNPLRPDPYESIHVVVSTSKIGEEAGEGLFSRTFIRKDQLVCLFNGIRRIKKGRVTRISANDEDWSDYRIVLDRCTDLDIPSECIPISNYIATLAHKANHTFGQAKNSRFDNLWHPRFGHIMSIVAVRNIMPGEEILVNYNYDVKMAPDWYQSLWKHYMQNNENSKKIDLEAHSRYLH